MTATLAFTLPEEAVEHQVALDGMKWRGVVSEHEQQLRTWLKHGHQFASADEALEAVRTSLWDSMTDDRLSLD